MRSPDDEPGMSAERRRRPRLSRFRRAGRWPAGLGLLVTVAAIVLQRWPGEAWWATALLVYAPQSAWIGLVGLALLSALWGRERVSCSLSAVAATLAGIVLMGFQVPLPQRPANSPRLVVATWNVHNEFQRMAWFSAALGRVGPDVVFLQEACDQAWVIPFRDWQGARVRYVQTMARAGAQEGGAVALDGSWRRACQMTIEHGGQRVRLLNVHMTTSDSERSLLRPGGSRRAYLLSTSALRRRQVDSIAEWASAADEPFIVAGDFNTPPASGVWGPLRAQATDAVSARGLGFGYTFRSDLPCWRIDGIWVSRHWRVLRCETFGGQLSDHKGVWAELELR